jgi:putative transposase
MIDAVEELKETTGVAEACRVLGVQRRSVYRARQPYPEPSPRSTPARALKPEEKAAVRAILNSERFCDCAPREVYATLLDEGRYFCDWRTMYRVLEEHDEVCERRNQRPATRRVKPELRATGPNQVWTWDISYLKGPGCFYYLYTILDMYSRYIVGWMIATCESAELAEKLIAASCAKQGIERGELVLHADRGSAMRSQTVSALLKKLGVTKSHSRPYTPTDNPYSEAHFKTMKYSSNYPERFSGIRHSRRWTRTFVQWYNHEHHHSGLGLMTPATVHYGDVAQVSAQRQRALDAAYAAHPERFVNGRPTAPEPPKEVWINRPKRNHDDETLSAEPAASTREPGTQATARAQHSEASLDVGQPLANRQMALVPIAEIDIFLPKFQHEL